MMEKISKSEFKARALEIMRQVEQTGESRIITDHGKPKLELRKLRGRVTDPLERLRGTVLRYRDPTSPVAEDDWEAA